MKFDRILFPIDFSDRCVQTVAYVAGIARKFNSHVTLLHSFDAYDPFGYGAASGTEIYGTPISMLRQHREAAMAEFGSAALEGIAVDRVIQDGEPSETTAQYVREHSINLVVMPTHGYGGFRRMLLGSVTSKVLHRVDCPVWTTAHCEGLDDRCAQCIGRIVCGVDLEPDSVDIVHAACELARQYSAEVRLVHAVGSDTVLAEAPFQRFLLDTATEKIATLQKRADTHLDTWVKQGDVAHVIRDAAADYGAGLAIIGRGHAKKLLGTLRTNVNEIVRESPCPVLSL
ncbi:MAG TPA: universal stress protein [Bryobacteraceae bacterium]|nr:universal stress protein [Bryobacteraceae bacterium]